MGQYNRRPEDIKKEGEKKDERDEHIAQLEKSLDTLASDLRKAIKMTGGLSSEQVEAIVLGLKRVANFDDRSVFCLMGQELGSLAAILAKFLLVALRTEVSGDKKVAATGKGMRNDVLDKMKLISDIAMTRNVTNQVNVHKINPDDPDYEEKLEEAKRYMDITGNKETIH